MSPTLPSPTSPLYRPNLYLLPANKFDEAAIAHLHTLSPFIWTPLIDLNHPLQPGQEPILNTYGLIDWLADINWPVAHPVSQLLLTLVNDDVSKRDAYGDVLVAAVVRVLENVDEWDWVYWTLVHVVDRIEDRTWMRESFGGSLRRLRERVPRQEEEGWEFAEVISRCLGEDSSADQGE
ncbi:hypothetical protein IQ06DRAFT_9393 [Phaeosphaeriaceae sp. SRC1lsM3a]|nr:hypothetical protein IQ06DRAFT_9393 [Stagonospora sp. SRC1lsM3a]